MSTYDVRPAGTGLTIQVEAEDELGVLDEAADLGFLPDGSEGIVEPAQPIGMDGGDAEDAIAEGEALDNGDFA